MNDEFDDVFPDFPSDDDGLQSVEDLPKEQSMKLRVDVIVSLLLMSTINEVSYIRRKNNILLTVDLEVEQNIQDETKLSGPEQA